MWHLPVVHVNAYFFLGLWVYYLIATHVLAVGADALNQEAKLGCIC